ncbi:MAG: hypothetical protein HQ542_00660, partial [Bacteroidia bacterium]|nr:hypothetical protein [Bacteroidia bacterium]
FNEAIFLRPYDINPRLNKALAFMYLKQYREAGLVYTEVIDLDPVNIEAYTKRGVARQYQGDLIGACDDWDTALSLGSDNALKYIEKFCDH